ncbi:hypothetical protein [Sphingopyxis sp. BSNA05]|uniref:hypothetical protein n=1 Tax=Sphingopyxis sp. BSNA05 TaxID=1236614 RepID=UPI0020B69851|nr:hypothetical protein [Sphingopyxis sp. BSNA05]
MPDVMGCRCLIHSIAGHIRQTVDGPASRRGERVDAQRVIILRDRIIGVDKIEGGAGKIFFRPLDRLQSRIAGSVLLRVDARLGHGGRNQDQAHKKQRRQNPFADR